MFQFFFFRMFQVWRTKVFVEIKRTKDILQFDRKVESVLVKRTNFRVSSGTKNSVSIGHLHAVCTLRKNFDLTQISYEVLINFNIVAEKYPKYACADVKQLHLIKQVRYHETIVKNNGSGFYPPNKFGP